MVRVGVRKPHILTTFFSKEMSTQLTMIWNFIDLGYSEASHDYLG